MCKTHNTKLNNPLLSFCLASACTVGERIWGLCPYHLLHLFAAVCLHIQERSEKMTHDNPTGNWIGRLMRLPANTVKFHNLPKTSGPGVQQHPRTSWPWRSSAGLVACLLVQLGIQLFPLRVDWTSPALEASDCLVAIKERGIKKKKSACRIT